MNRREFFTGEAAAKQLEDSLRRLQVDTVDLLQFHEIIRMSDPERIFAPGGAYEAMVKAKKDGKIRYLGFPLERGELKGEKVT